MKRIGGFICLWVAVGILIMLVVSDVIIGIILILMLLLLWYNLCFCK